MSVTNYNGRKVVNKSFALVHILGDNLSQNDHYFLKKYEVGNATLLIGGAFTHEKG